MTRKATTALLGGVAVGLAVFGCARTVSPRGGDVPETPMQVVATSPDTFAVVEPFDGPVRFQFDRRGSERPTSGQLRDAVLVSPRTGEVQVDHQRRGLEVRVEGGFREGTVYRVTLLPTLQDLWQNPLAGPYDLIFSTGPELEPNVLGGLVTDRLTGEEADGVTVDAVPRDEELVHSTVTDSTGIFTFPYLPADRYRVRAYQDQNRNREPDFAEAQDSLDVEVSAGDTLVVTELALLAPDTTPAVLESATPVDSVTVRLTFDDPLDPELALDGVRIELSREDAPAPRVREILHLHEWEERLAEEEEAEEDPDPEEPAAPPEEAPAEADEPLLPAYEIVVILEVGMAPAAAYTLHVEGLRNLNGLPGGGGEAEFEGPLPPEEPEEDPPPDPDAVPDTVPPPDTLPSRSSTPP